jgi:hypothetical protein
MSQSQLLKEVVGALDHIYLSEWVEKLDLKELWQRLQREAEIVE